MTSDWKTASAAGEVAKVTRRAPGGASKGRRRLSRVSLSLSLLLFSFFSLSRRNRQKRRRAVKTPLSASAIGAFPYNLAHCFTPRRTPRLLLLFLLPLFFFFFLLSPHNETG